jgi:hypothetical protein
MCSKDPEKKLDVEVEESDLKSMNEIVDLF